MLPTARSLLSEPITKAAVYDLEQAVEAQVKEKYFTLVLEDQLPVDKLLDDHLVRKLHGELYGEIWSWAGVYRKTEANIGIAPERIAVELRNSLGTILYRWKATEDWTPHQLGIAVHAEAVRIHPFMDGMAGRPAYSLTSSSWLCKDQRRVSCTIGSLIGSSTSSYYVDTTDIVAPTSSRHLSAFSHLNSGGIGRP